MQNYRQVGLKNVLFCALLFGSSALYMAFKALTNDRGLIINHMFYLSLQNATIFYWEAAGLCCLLIIIVFASYFCLPRSQSNRKLNGRR